MANEGVYVLWLYLPQTCSITIGKLGKFPFEQGVYAYVGRAQRNLEQRVARHRRLDKKFHWHIDYFRAKADFLGATLFFDHTRDKECWLVRELMRIPTSLFPVPGFGSSDCECGSHFVYLPLAWPRVSTS